MVIILRYKRIAIIKIIGMFWWCEYHSEKGREIYCTLYLREEKKMSVCSFLGNFNQKYEKFTHTRDSNRWNANINDSHENYFRFNYQHLKINVDKWKFPCDMVMVGSIQTNEFCELIFFLSHHALNITIHKLLGEKS